MKILQYGCQMLVGYWGRIMSQELLEAINSTRTAASNARKTFWMLKPIFHVNDVWQMLQRPLSNLEKIDCFEAFMWFCYYIFENLIFLARLRIPGFLETNFEWGCNMTWFVGDTVFFLSSIYRLGTVISSYFQISNSRCLDDNARRNSQDDMVDKSFGLVIALTELGVSVHYFNVLRFAEGHVGAMGVVSSSFIILQELFKGYRELRPLLQAGEQNRVEDASDPVKVSPTFPK